MSNGNGWMLLADKNSKSYGFAQKISEYFSTERELDIPLREIEMTNFGNGERGLHIPSNLRGKDVYFIHDSDKNPQQWWVELLLIKDLLLNSSAGSVTFVLPDMMYSRQDRKDRPHVPISARALADSISPGTRRIITMDLHAPQIQGIYPQEVPVDNLYSFPAVVQHIKTNHPYILENLVIVSPDAGGTHRARAFLSRLENKSKEGEKYSFALMDKTRAGAGSVKEMKLIGDVSNKNALVIDDMISSGGTLIEAGKVLREAGAKKLMCYGAHGLFTDGTHKIKIAYDVVMTSNSHSQEDKDIEVIDVAPLIAEAIYRAQNGLSISKLFE
jgi:ribose-phosphate pyrophosphokinase